MKNNQLVKHITALVKKEQLRADGRTNRRESQYIHASDCPSQGLLSPSPFASIWFNKSTDKFLGNHTISTNLIIRILIMIFLSRSSSKSSKYGLQNLNQQLEFITQYAASILAPFDRSNSTTAVCPLQAAIIRAVCPFYKTAEEMMVS